MPYAMLQFRLIPVFALFLFLSPDGIAAQGPLEFNGEVSRGETLIHRFEFLETTYEFRLLPAGGGWTIWIGNPENRDHNFVAVVTPPYRGINPVARDDGERIPGRCNLEVPVTERLAKFFRQRVQGHGHAVRTLGRRVLG